MAMFLIEGDLDGARYLWKRLPPQIKNNTEMTSLWGIGKGLLTRDNVTLKQIFSSTTWLHAQPFISDIGDRMKSRQLREIAQAYSLISTVAMGQALLTSSSADTLAIAQEYGWDVVDNGEYIRPRSLPMEGTEGGNGLRSYAKGTRTDMIASRMLLLSWSLCPPSPSTRFSFSAHILMFLSLIIFSCSPHYVMYHRRRKLAKFVHLCRTFRKKSTQNRFIVRYNIHFVVFFFISTTTSSSTYIDGEKIITSVIVSRLVSLCS